MALSAVLKTRWAGGEGRGARGAARCLDLKAGRGAQDPLSRDPALAHLARRRTEAPGQRRSAWRTRGAEQMAVWAPAPQAPWRRLAGRAAWERVVAALARIGGGGVQLLYVRLSVHPPASVHGALVLQEFIYPDPGNDVIGTAPAPFPHLSGGPAAAGSAHNLTPLASAARRWAVLGRAVRVL